MLGSNYSATFLTTATLMLLATGGAAPVDSEEPEESPVPIFQWEASKIMKRLEVDEKKFGRFKRSPRFKLGRKGASADSGLGLDLLVVTDYSVYAHFFESAVEDDHSAVNAIYQYYTGVLHELSKMYSSRRLGYTRFHVYPTGIIVAKNLVDAPWIFDSKVLKNVSTQQNSRSVDAYETLRNFQSWVKDNADSLPEHDHAIAITRLDLERYGDTNAQGIAFVGRICKIGESISIVEDVGPMATVAIAGHELAHSLGAEHDGQNGTNGCSTVHNYLMAPAVATTKDTMPNTFTFSECTIKQIKRHILGSRDKAECLRHSPLEKAGYKSLHDGNTMPGQLFDVHQQCQHSFGLEFRFCSSNDYYLKQMCRQIWCRNVTAGRRSACQSKPYLPALTGTTCGNQMWCINGACVEDDEAPAQEGCKFGDRDTSFCLKLTVNEPSKCQRAIFNRFCCESCRQFKRKLYRKLRF